MSDLRILGWWHISSFLSCNESTCEAWALKQIHCMIKESDVFPVYSWQECAVTHLLQGFMSCPFRSFSVNRWLNPKYRKLHNIVLDFFLLFKKINVIFKWSAFILIPRPGLPGHLKYLSPFPVCPVKTADVNTVWWCLTLTSIASVCQVVQLSDHYPVEVVLKSSALFLQATPLLSLISASVILWSFLSALWSSRALNALYTRLSFFFFFHSKTSSPSSCARITRRCPFF